MRRSFYVIPVLVLALASCSAEKDKKDVCGCEVDFSDMQAKLALSAELGDSAAIVNINAQYKDNLETCTKLRKELGEETYLKYASECEGK